jgi:hypothetical protein
MMENKKKLDKAESKKNKDKRKEYFVRPGVIAITRCKKKKGG